MSTNIILKKSSVSGRSPTTSQLEFGELAVNTYDGKIYFKIDDGTERIIAVSPGPVTNSATTPSSATEGQIWYETDTGNLYVYNNGSWDEVVSGGDDYANVEISSSAPSAPQAGDLWYDDTDSSLNIYYNDGSTAAWIALNDFDIDISSELSNTDTDSLTEGSTNLYFTDARADARISAASIEDLSDVQFASGDPTNGQSLIYNSTSGVWEAGQSTVSLSSQDTDDLAEGSSNLYFTNARARGAISVTGDLSYNISTGVLSATTYDSNDFAADFSSQNTNDLSEGTSNLYYTDARVQTKLGDVSGHIVPDTTETYDLGSSTYRFRDLYLSGNTLNLGGATISATSGGAVTLPSGTSINSGGTVLDTSGSTTDDLSEGSTNLYYTDTRVQSYLTTNTFATESYVDTAVAGVVDSAPGALDTLNELAAALGDDANFSTTISTALGNRLRIDTNAQGLSATEKSNAVTNLGLATVATTGAFSDLTGAPTNVSTFTNDAGYLTSESNDLSANVTWTNVPNANITESSVTQHQAALSITESQISDLQTYLTAETDTLATVTGRGAATTTTAVIPFYYANQSAFPSATTYHGAIAHSHSDGAMYFAHGGSWNELANASDLSSYQTTSGLNTAIDSHLNQSGPTSGYVLSWNGSDYAWVQNGSGGLTVTETGSGGTSVTSVTEIQFDDQSGFSVTDEGSGVVTIAMNSTFKYWEVSGQDTVVAEGLDTIELIAGTGMTLTTDATNKTVTFAATSSGSSVTTSSSAPSSPSDGDLWFDTDDGSLNIYYTDTDTSQWVALNDFDNIVPTRVSSSAPSGAVNGDLWFDTDDGTLNIYYDDGDTAQWVALNDFSTLLSTSDTDDISEGSTNLYYTDARVASYLTTNSYATETYVDTAVNNVIDSAPGALDTLNELAAALGDDANFSTTVTNSLATKLEDITSESIGDLSDVTITTPSSGQVIKYNGTAWVNSSDDDSGIALTDLSITTNSVGTAALSYDNTTGVFTYTPPDLSSYLTSYTVTESDVTAHEAALSITESQISDLGSYIELTDLSIGTDAAASGSGGIAYSNTTGVFTYTPPDLSSYLTSYTVTESDVTAHEAALSITESQISDLGSYIELGDLSVSNATASGGGSLAYNISTGAFTFTPPDLSAKLELDDLSVTQNTASGSGALSYNISTGVFSYTPPDLSSYIELTDLSIGTDAAASGSGGLAYNLSTGVFTYTPPDLSSYLTSETNDLSAAVTWANVPDANITESSVTQHEAALTITESQISDLGSYLTGITSESISDLSDVDLGSGGASNGQILTWNSVTGAFEPDDLPTNVSEFTNDSGYLTSETTTSLSISSNILTYTDEAGNDTDIDLSLYLDDTNLARITSGSVNPSTGIATFTRSDSTNFTVDFSDFLDDTNLARITAASFDTSDGTLTLTRGADSTTVTVDLDGRYAELTDLSIGTDAAASGSGGLAYNNTTGVFTYTPPDLSSYLTSYTETDTLSDVVGRGATTTTTAVIPFYYANQSSFPNATTYHGAIAHSHSDGTMFFAHGGSWVELANASDLSSYLTSETNDLTAAVTWADVPDANITESSVTQHQAALSVTESQISDLQSYLTGISSESIGDLSDVDTTTSAPTDGQVLTWDNANSKWAPADSAGGSGGASVTVSSTAPSSPSSGDLWFDSDDGSLNIYYTDADTSQWVDLNDFDSVSPVLVSDSAPSVATAGQLWFDSTDGSFNVYYDDYWVALNDNNLLSGNSTLTVDTFAGDGNTTAFTLTQTPSSANDLIVTVDGVVQRPTTDYTVSATTLTFVTAPYNGAVVASRVISGVVYNPAETNWQETSGTRTNTYNSGDYFEEDYVSTLSAYVATAGNRLFVDCSSNAVTVTLPASPSMGDEIRIIDATGNAATNNITINRNGNNIEGSASDLTIDVNRAAFGLVYYNSAQGWLLMEK